MKTLQYWDIPSRGFRKYAEYSPSAGNTITEGVSFEDPSHPIFIRHIWFRNRKPEFEALIVACTERPPDQQQRAEIVAGAIGYLLKKAPPKNVIFISKEEIRNHGKPNPDHN